MTEQMTGDSNALGIVLLNWNSYDVTKDCLNCFRQIEHPYLIVVVDNGSTDDSVRLLKKNYPEVKLIESETNLGFAGGNNLGMKYCLKAGVEHVMLLNNDTLFETDFAKPLLVRITQHKNVGAIQPKINFNHNRKKIWNGGGVYYFSLGHSKTIGEGKWDTGQFDQTKTTGWITGCCFLIKSGVLKEVGFLDEDFFIYHEDVDLSLRIRKAGYKLEYCPEGVIYHIAGVSQKAKVKTKEGILNPRTHYLNIRNQLLVARRHLKWYHAPSACIFLSLYIMAHLAYFLGRRRFKKARAVLSGINDGLTYKV